MSAAIQYTEQPIRPHANQFTAMPNAFDLSEHDLSTDSPESEPLTFHRFSELPIWQKQRDFFVNQGVDAWRNSLVPHYVTSNPSMAHTYVEMLLAFWLDNLQNHTLTPEQPLYILELGAGSGIFSHAILTQLLARLPHTPLKDYQPTLIISDVVQSNLDFARSHSKLTPFINNNQVDFALVDAETFTDIQLQHANISLQANTLQNPLAVIANYVFDGLSQDLISIHYGKIFDGYMAWSNPPNEQQSNFIQQPHYDWRALSQQHTYPALLLQYYVKALDSNPLLIPTGAIHCIQALRRFSPQACLILSADRGLCQLTQLRQQSDPGFANHGSFSLPVNYHALSVLLEAEGDLALTCQRKTESLAMAAMVLKPESSPQNKDNHPSFALTQMAFTQYIEQFNPDDAYTMKRALEITAEQLDSEQLLSFLRLSRWDYRILDLCYQPLMQQLSSLTSDEHRLWAQAIEQTWAHYFPIGDRIEPCKQLGILATELGMWGLGQTCLNTGLALHPHLALDADTTGRIQFYLAQCALQLGHTSQAKTYAEQALILAKQVEQQLIAQNQATAQTYTKLEFEHLLPAEIEPLFTPHTNQQTYSDELTTSDRHTGSVVAACKALLNEINSHHCPSWYNPECKQAMHSLSHEQNISLQPLAQHHAPDVFYQLRDPNIAIMARLPDFDSLQQVEDWIAQQQHNPNIKTLAVIHQQYGLIGAVCIEQSPASTNNHTALFYFWIGTDHQGQGYGGHAAQLLVAAAAQCFGIQRFYTSAYKDNVRSLKVLQNCDWRRLEVSVQELGYSDDENSSEQIQYLVFEAIHAQIEEAQLKNELLALLDTTGVVDKNDGCLAAEGIVKGDI